jgi:GT2 family glycosyltransferase
MIPQSEMLVSIIIVNFNGLNRLQKCINSILKNNYRKYEIIIVDNNSNDGSIDFVKKEFPKIKLIKLEQNYGYAKPNNIGAKIAQGEFLFFLNNDTIIQPTTIKELVNAMEKPEIGICQSLLLHPDRSVDSSGDYVNHLGFPYSSKTQTTKMKSILSARGAAMMVKKKIFLELLGFDEKFFVSFEDVDIGWRSWLWGYKILLVPSSVVIHEGGVTVNKLSKIVKFHGIKNFLILNLTFYERPIILSFFNILFLFLTTKFSKNCRNEKNPIFYPTFFTSLRGFFWILKNIKYILNKRKLIKSNRKLSTNDLIKLKLIKEK